MNATRKRSPRSRREITVSRFRIDGDEYALLGLSLEPTAEMERLTPAEREVVAFVLSDLTNEEIAAARGTSPRTVANQLASIYTKLGISSRRELIALCS